MVKKNYGIAVYTNMPPKIESRQYFNLLDNDFCPEKWIVIAIATEEECDSILKLGGFANRFMAYEIE